MEFLFRWGVSTVEGWNPCLCRYEHKIPHAYCCTLRSREDNQDKCLKCSFVGTYRCSIECVISVGFQFIANRTGIMRNMWPNGIHPIPISPTWIGITLLGSYRSIKSENRIIGQAEIYHSASLKNILRWYLVSFWSGPFFLCPSIIRYTADFHVRTINKDNDLTSDFL